MEELREARDSPEPALEGGDTGGALPPQERERWLRVKALFVEVVEQQRTAREAALRELEASDPAAAEEARSLLRRYDSETTNFLERTAPLHADEAPKEAPDLTGRTIDGYVLTSAVGRGGMGMVYDGRRAEDGKRVAVKLLRWHGDPAAVAQQMRAERRILAGLEHDNIARLIDGGITAEGLPYFTLEFVDGLPIGKYCEALALDVSSRLCLFFAVCGAVEYAHQRLVVHCDIKPANILITADGVPKLLDFGIARALAPENRGASVEGSDSAVRAPLASGLTPEYASPEQVRGEPVTTATDVYALGLLLHELLTGCRAQEMESFTASEIRRVVCDTEPLRPSLAAPEPLRRRLSGDLDAIVRKALSKSPSRRYGSAGELADDVRRHLDWRPVEARRGGLSYRAWRFARRHRAMIFAAGLVLVSLVGGTVMAVREARRAQRRFEEVRQLAGSFLFEFHDAIRDLPGATPARKLLVTKALEYLDRLSSEAENDRSLQRELAVAYQRVGDVQGYSSNANLGDAPGAIASFRRAVELGEQLTARPSPDAASRLTLASALEKLGTMLRSSGDSAGSRQALDRAERLLVRLLGEAPGDAEAGHELHVVYIRQGQLARQEGDADAALRRYRSAQQVDEAVLGAAPQDRRALRDKSVALSFIAAVVGERDPRRGLELYRELLPPAEQLAASDPGSAELQRDLLVGHEDVAQMQAGLGLYAESLEHHAKALAIAEALLRADPSNEQALQDLSVRHAQIGDVLRLQGNLSAALASYERSLEIDGRVAALQPTDSHAAENLGWSHLNVAGVLADLKQPGPALEHYRSAIDIATPFSERDPANADLRSLLADAEAGLGETLLFKSAPGAVCPEPARQALERAVALWAALDLEVGPDRDHRDRVVARLAACG